MIRQSDLLRSLTTFLLFIALSVPAMTQSLTCTTNASKVALNSAFTITYTASGKKIGNVGKPKFKNFELIGSPSVSTKQSNYNGKISMSRSYTYTVLAKKKGTFKLPFVSVTIDGYGYTSNPVTVEVVEGKGVNAIAEDKRKIYIKSALSDSVALVGQMVELVYTIYYQRNYSDIQLSKVDDFSDFFERKLEANPNVDRQMINGEEFYVREILKVGLTAQRIGTFNIDPAEFVLDLPKGNRRRTIFDRSPRNLKRFRADGLELEIVSPPAGAPASFSGAVGKFAMRATIDKRKATTDDAFVINMEISGDGETKTFSAPSQPKVDGIEMYDPKELRDSDRKSKGRITSYKNIEYLLVPKEPGNYTIRPEFTYYDTDSNDYVTIDGDVFRVQVTQGSKTAIADDRDLSVAQSLRPAREDEGAMSQFILRFFDAFWWSGIALSIAALGWMLLKKRKMVEKDNLDPAEKRRRQAMELARAKLEKARGYQQQGDSRKFYEELSTAMNGYLGNKYGLANSDFQKDQILRKLDENGVESSLTQQYLDILKTCEMALFAGQPSSKMEELLSSSSDLIMGLEA